MTDLTAPVYALPLDMTRVLLGGVLFFYFLDALRHARDFSDPDGLIDHRLSIRLLPPTRLGLFQPGMPGWLFRAVFLAACIASLLVVVGWHPRAAAGFMFVVAVSKYRWNVLVAYLDDAMMHTLCLWLVLLPVGRTLVLPDLLAGSPAIREWMSATVPGLAPRAFLANMALIYLVAGLYKFTSPMWRDGSAMHAALRMPIARAPAFWTFRYRTLLRLVTHASLVAEPLFALIFVLPAGSLAKWPLVAGAVVFHLGIALTLKIPYSNTAMLGPLALAFGPEIMHGGLGLPAASGGRSGRIHAVGGGRGHPRRASRHHAGLGHRGNPDEADGAVYAEGLDEPGARAPLGAGHLPELPALRLGRRAKLPRALRGQQVRGE